MTEHPFRVIVADNYHYQDRDEEYEHGTFGTSEAAVKACMMIVDRCLVDLIEPNMTPAALFQAYQHFGQDPFVIGPPGCWRPPFSAWDYARERCDKILTDAG